MYFQELFIWLAREHQLSQLIDAPGGSCWLLEPLWAFMVALGGSWRKYMRTIVLLSKTDTFQSPGLFWTSPKRYILDHSKCMKTIVLSISGSKARKSPNQALVFMTSGTKTRKSWHSITSKNILLSDHCSLGHPFVGPPPTTHRARGGPTKNMCLRKSVSIIICPLPLSHPTLCCDLQSRHSRKGNVLML